MPTDPRLTIEELAKLIRKKWGCPVVSGDELSDKAARVVLFAVAEWLDNDMSMPEETDEAAHMFANCLRSIASE